MSIFTTPVFLYGYTVTTNNNILNFSEGGIEKTATIKTGTYTIETLAVEIANELNIVGTNSYTASSDFITRKFTITSNAQFDLLFATGSNSGISIGSVIGFSTDQTGMAMYESEVETGTEYSPQFPLQNYVDFEDFKEFANAQVNESASGSVQVYSIGRRSFMEANIKYATDQEMQKGAAIANNPNAVSELRAFMDFAITKSEMLFFKDKENKSTTKKTILLERTPTSSTGTGYRLKELYSQNLIGYFETGVLKFREVL